MNKETKEYLKELRQAFPVFHKNEKRFLNDLKSSILIYSEENPSCDYADLCYKFGTPQNIATTYLSNLDSEVYSILMKRVQYIRIMMVSFVSFLIIILVITTGFYVAALKQEADSLIYKEETVIYHHTPSEAIEE